MKSCKNCFWCRIALSLNKNYKCKLEPNKRFNYSSLHGWFCKNYYKDPEVK